MRLTLNASKIDQWQFKKPTKKSQRGSGF